MNSELLIISLNTIILLMAYVLVYPKMAANNIFTLSCLDLLFSSITLLAVGTKYWGSGRQFNILIGEANWFWFTLITYVLIETPLTLWYMKKNNITWQ